MIVIGLYGLLGYETAFRLFCQHEEELKNRFSKRFLGDLIRLFSPPADDAFTKETVFFDDPFLYITPVGEGGLYGTLWKACEKIGQASPEKAGVKPGCQVELLRVPIRQEVVEICELYEEDPYETPSAGCFLVIWEMFPDEDPRGEYEKDLLSILKESAIIGKLTNNGRRILIWDDKVRYLTPPQRQKKDMMDRKNGVHTC